MRKARSVLKKGCGPNEKERMAYKVGQSWMAQTHTRNVGEERVLSVYLLGLERLPLQYFDEFSGEPAFAAFPRPALPPLRLDLHPRVDLHARAGIQFAHDGHDLVLLQGEF